MFVKEYQEARRVSIYADFFYLSVPSVAKRSVKNMQWSKSGQTSPNICRSSLQQQGEKDNNVDGGEPFINIGVTPLWSIFASVREKLATSHMRRLPQSK
jgi:hypothetical protein